MKKKVTIGLLTCVMFLLTAIPALAATWYNDWSFTMNNRYVNGGDNDVYYNLKSGRLQISGYVDVVSKDKGADPNPQDILIVVYKKVTGPDDVVRSFKVSVNQQFYMDLGEISSGEYYIEASKPKDDGHNIKAKGEFKVVR